MRMTTIRQLPVLQPAAGPHSAPTTLAPSDVEPTDWGAARCLIAATAMAGLLGVPLGFYLGYAALTGQMAAVPWAGLVQAHGQLQLFGWIGLAILGVTFHAMANLFDTAEPPGRVAWTVLVLQVAGVLLRLAAPLIPDAGGATGAWLLTISALAFAGAFGVTLEAHMRTMPRRSRQGRAPSVLPRFLLVGLSLWLVALLVNLDAAIEALRFGPAAPGAISAGRDAVIVAASTGGLAMIALGMSLRVAVGWANLSLPDLRRAGQAWWPLTLAVLLRAVSAALGGAFAWLDLSAAVLWVAGVAWYFPVLRGLWSPSVVTAGGGRSGEADPPLAWFLRAAYVWLAVSAVLALLEAAASLAGGFGGLTPAQAADAGRHALLLGYLGMLTAGLTGRLPTAFLDLGDAGIRATRGLYRATWLLLLVAAALRVGAPLLGGMRLHLIATSGIAGTLALWCVLGVLARIAQLVRARDARRPKLAGLPPA
jgi:hypothetical protein